jgi:hypothetical protein
MQQKVNGLQTQLNAGLLPKGFYMVKWQSNGQQAVQKLIMK